MGVYCVDNSRNADAAPEITAHRGLNKMAANFQTTLSHVFSSILIEISLKFVPKGLINIDPGHGLVPNRHQIMTWTSVDLDACPQATRWKSMGEYCTQDRLFSYTCSICAGS